MSDDSKDKTAYNGDVLAFVADVTVCPECGELVEDSMCPKCGKAGRAAYECPVCHHVDGITALRIHHQDHYEPEPACKKCGSRTFVHYEWGRRKCIVCEEVS